MSNTNPSGESSNAGRTWKEVAFLLMIYGTAVYIVLTFGNNFLHVDDSFESGPESSPTVKWYYDGTLPVTLVPTATHGAQAARLGEPVEQAPRSQKEQARLYRTMVIPNYERHVLTFWYRMVTNDIIHYSDFWVYLLTSDGNLKEIKRDGFRTCGFSKEGRHERPPARFDLGWRTVSYDLSAFKGETVTLVFENRNLHSAPGFESLGIWTYVDYVDVVDATPPPTPPCPPCAYLPVVMYTTCDPIPTGAAILAISTSPTMPPARPPTPTPEPPGRRTIW